MKFFFNVSFITLLYFNSIGQSQMMFTVLDITPKSEVTLHLGGSNYLGDLVQSDFWYFPETKASFGLSYKHDINNNIKAVGTLSHGSISGSDLNFESRKTNTDNLNFKSQYSYLGLGLEWYPFGREKRTKYYDEKGEMLSYFEARYSDKKLFNKKGIVYEQRENLSFVRNFIPFISGGIVMMYNNPIIGSNGTTATPWATLIEKNGSYTKTLFGLSSGAGVTYFFNDKWNVGLNAQIIYCFSDYVDGWSEVRDPDDLDWVTQAGLSLGYRF